MAKQWLRSQIERGAKSVDKGFEHPKGKGAILGFAVLTRGKINEGDARDWEFDDASLSQVVELGNSVKSGIKSRFGHPNQSGDALGTFLGRAHNFRLDGDIVRADLYIDQTAYSAPDGDLATYVLSLAENDPAAFGSSMVFDADLEYRLNTDGTKEKDEQGKDKPALVRFKKLFAVDIVDDPAANKGMFGKFIEGNAQLSSEMTKFLDKFLTNEDAVNKTIAFLERYRANNNEDAETKTEEDSMDLKDLTIDMLKSERKDIVDAIAASAISDAVKIERSRVSDILAKAKAYQGVDETAVKCIADGDDIVSAESKFKDAKLAALQAAAPATPGPGAEGSEAKLEGEAKWKDEFSKDKDIQSEFGSETTYIAFKKAEASGRARVMQAKK